MQTMQAATAFLGFSFFSVTTRLVHIGGGAWRVVMSSLPREFLGWYDQEQIADDDPLLLRSLESVAPFYSDELDLGRFARTPRALSFLNKASECGAGFSLSCAQHDPVGAVTIASFLCRQAPGSFNRDECREKAAWIVAHLHDALDRIVVRQLAARRGQLGALTRLECSMLELLARGYAAREVSGLLGVSPRSVRYHANRVREKMGALSLNQAVGRAIESRQITLSGATLPSHWSGLPKLVHVAERDSAWPVRDPSFEMAVREVRSATSLERLAQAAQRAAAAQGFQRFAFVLRTPAAAEASQLVLTNDPAGPRGADGAGALVRSCVAARSRLRCVPRFWDEMSQDAAGDGRRAAVAHGITGMTLAADGCSSALSLGAPARTGADRFEDRRACFRLTRELHERACLLGSAPRPSLSDGDLQALTQMVGGASIRKVAVRRQQKERSLRYRVSIVARKLGARNSRHAVAIATERGLLPRQMGRLLSRELIRPAGVYPDPGGVPA